MSYDIQIDNIKSSTFGIYPVKRPNFQAPQKRYKELEIPGRDGKLFEDTGFYEDVTINIEFNYISQQGMWLDRWRNAKKWFLSSIGKRLSFSDDNMVFYKIKKIEIGENQRTSIKIGVFTVSVTLDPYTYLTSGILKYKYDQCCINRYEMCMPKLCIKGEGMCTLIINGNKVVLNVGQNITIDTERRITYRGEKTIENTSMNGDYEGLYLLEGENTISISNDFEMDIVPNWRMI